MLDPDQRRRNQENHESPEHQRVHPARIRIAANRAMGGEIIRETFCSIAPVQLRCHRRAARPKTRSTGKPKDDPSDAEGREGVYRAHDSRRDVPENFAMRSHGGKFGFRISDLADSRFSKVATMA